MACGGCNTASPVTKDTVENIVNKALKEAEFQGELKACDGSALPKGSKVLQCNELVNAVNEAIKDGSIEAVTDVTFDAGKLKIKKGSKEKDITLPFAQIAIGDKEVVLTNPNGEHVAVPKAGDVLTEDDFDKTIVKGANEANKLGVKAGDGLKVGEDGSLQIGEIFSNKPILGKGTKADPLKLALNSDQFQVNAATGEVSLKPTNSSLIKNLNTGVQKVGYSTLYGFVNKGLGDYVPGVPANINSTNATENATSEISQLVDGEAYDFNGWQIASPAQVDQYLVGTDKAVWHRVNDGGINNDGTLKDPTNWSVWHRETNVTANVMQIEAMQKQVDDLNKRVGALEELLGSFVNMKDASGKVLLGSIKP